MDGTLTGVGQGAAVEAGLPCTSVPPKMGGDAWWCQVRREPRALTMLRGGCGRKTPLALPRLRSSGKVGSSMAATAHRPGALPRQEFSLLGCPALHGLLLKVKGVVLPCLKNTVQLSDWAGANTWGSQFPSW